MSSGAAGGRRGRRATKKQIDYSKEQEFSDDDVFEDGATAAATSPIPSEQPLKKRGRKPASATAAAAATASPYEASRFRYTERGYDPSLPPLRERFTFLPELEADGSPKVELIVGRRPINHNNNAASNNNDAAVNDEDDEADATTTAALSSSDENEDHLRKKKQKRKIPEKKKRGRPRKEAVETPSVSIEKKAMMQPQRRVEYEYRIKYKGKSYLHLEWKVAHELESMNKSAKSLLRRFLKKIGSVDCSNDELEDYEFDPSYAQPQKIVDEDYHEFFVDLTDKELMEYEQEQKRAEEEERAAEEAEQAEEQASNDDTNIKIEGLDESTPDKLTSSTKSFEPPPSSNSNIQPPLTTETISIKADNSENMDVILNDSKTEVKPEEIVSSAKNIENGGNEEEERIGDPGTLSLEQIRAILAKKEDSYYPVVEGSDNPYRDGYITEPPRKARASYLFFQGTYRSEYQRRYPGAAQSEIMTLLGDAWRSLTEEQQEPFVILAKEEAAQFDHHRALLEKAQKPNEMWQPLRRCQKVLDKLKADVPFASIFLEPVDTSLFPDYEEYVDQPMDLGTVQRKLLNRKYPGPENFARDMRKIWQNCKVYNQHGSAIWHVADTMSKQFERLYQAWVLAFRERYWRWANPKARPWEPTCRSCASNKNNQNTSDDQMIMCDHCDALYKLSCVNLRSLPTGVWLCPVCCSASSSEDGGHQQLLSSVAEQAARKRAEMGDVPKKRVMRKMFLVKWAGLGYENCTWETQDDLQADSLIQEFRRLNNMAMEDPHLTENDLKEVLRTDQPHLTLNNAGGSSIIPQLRCQLYSQTRGFHFLKFGQPLPPLLASACGPQNTALPTPNEQQQRPQEVVECLQSLLTQVERGDLNKKQLYSVQKMPPLLTGEYDTVVPITSKGLMMNVGEVNGSVAFLGYRTFPDGTKGPAEKNFLIRHVGDQILAVDGVSTIGKTFPQVIAMLRDSAQHQFVHMRFLSHRYANSCNSSTLWHTSSMGGSSFSQTQLQLLKKQRRPLLLKRYLENINGKNSNSDNDNNGDDGSDGSVAPEIQDSNDSSEDDVSVGEYEPDSDDEDLIYRQKAREHFAMQEAQSLVSQQSPTVSKPNSKDLSSSIAYEEKKTEQPQTTLVKTEGELKPLQQSSNIDKKFCSSSEVYKKQETTQSLALQYLGMDLGYSSDEAGDEDVAYYLDGLDDTFTTQKSIQTSITQEENGVPSLESSSPNSSERLSSIELPAKRIEFSNIGDRSKICAAVTLTTQSPPNPEDFDNYPHPSTNQLLKAKKQKEEADAAIEKQKQKEEDEKALKLLEEQQAQKLKEQSLDQSTEKLSKTKIEQVSTTSNEVIRVWASAEAASATLQLNLKNIKQVLRGVYSEDVGDEVGGYRWRYAAEEAKVTKIADIAKEKDKGRKAFLEFQDKLYDHEKPHNYKNGNRLRDYQIDGVNWLASCWYKRHSSILADEMGLGKTVQIVTYIEHLFRAEKIHRPFLVVVPLSTVEHWRREFEGWTDMICCVYHDRQRIWRDIMREYEWYFVDRPHTPEYLKFDVLVTTYDTLIGDFDVIGQIPWRVTVVDEAHRLRNQKGKLLECMKELSARGTLHYGYQSRVLMTGTPLQNNIQELWTLLNFIEPYKFPSLEEFESNYGNMASREQVEGLQRKISPFMLRRVKEDVAKDIPNKEETLIDVELTSIQKQYYRAIFEHNHSFLNMGNSRVTAPKLMNIQMELRKCCNHPFLLDGIEHRETEKQHRELLEAGKLDGKSSSEIQQILHEQGYIQTSGKMVLLDKLLPKLRREGHKVLIFSQMVKMLDLLAEYCDMRGFRFERLDGRVRGNERQKAIDRFETEDDSFIFMLSTRAGGVGINLTAADICIIFDSDWNPQNDVQAQARCHRIGQTKSVMIYRLITSRSFEQEMFDRASKKLGLEQAVLGTFGQDDDDGKPTAKEMEQLLKKGAYALLEDNNDEITKEFCADDIESILAKRTRTRVVEGAKTASWLNKQNFTKSKFTADSKNADLNVDDPLFWQKVMPDFVTPAIMLTKLDELETQANNSSDIGNKHRGRKRKPSVKQVEAMSENKEDNTSEKLDEEPTRNGDGKLTSDEFHLTRTNQKKINKFIQDLKSMMDGILEDKEDDNLPDSDKSSCQKLLLTISLKEKLFSAEQRNIAKVFLKRLEGDRRRRCRTSGDISKDNDEPDRTVVNESLMIRSSKKRRKKRLKEEVDDEPQSERKSKKSRSFIDQDNSQNSDWSDFGEDIYHSSKTRASITKKEARRRRAWASDKDEAAAAGRQWPSFPRSKVVDVLGTLLDEVIKYDKSKVGLFSEPVPQDVFPEYYEVVEKPMDYSTMKEKLSRGAYRSAQAMQKDFVLVMSNCIQFNSPSSEIVREARQQALMRPNLLKKAALEHKLFIAEDGAVLEILSDDEDEYKEVNDEDSTENKKDRRKKGKSFPNDTKRKSPQKGGKTKKKVVRCGECDPCNKEDCGKCPACLDKRKFGGTGLSKQSCHLRKCNNMQEIVMKPKRGRPRKKKQPNESPIRSGKSKGISRDNANDEGSISSHDKKKPRIRISLNGSSTKKESETSEVQFRIPKKRKNQQNEFVPGNDNDSMSEGEIDETPKETPVRPKKMKKSAYTDNSNKAEKEEKRRNVVREQHRRKKRKKPGLGKSRQPENFKHEISDSDSELSSTAVKSDSHSGESNDVNIYMNPTLHQNEREMLDGSFEAARKNYTKHGPWVLPKEIEDKFLDVAKITLNKISRADHYSLFAEEVSDEQAPGYSEVVENPMDFGTMRRNLEDHAYGTGPDALSTFYSDFLLVMDNCSLYNDDNNEIMDEASRLFGILPEIFANACVSVAGKNKRKTRRKN